MTTYTIEEIDDCLDRVLGAPGTHNRAGRNDPDYKRYLQVWNAGARIFFFEGSGATEEDKAILLYAWTISGEL